MKILTVVGTRPEIIRLSLVIPRLDAAVEHTLVHTGQNAADNLSGVFFRELALREPDEHLGVDTSSFGRQLATLFEGFEAVLDRHRPDRVLILGDTNSALVAFNCKRRGIPVFHMEAGNRCYDDRVPEEVNRRVIDHCSTVLMPYTQRSAENLVREGIERDRIFIIGNPINEVLLATAALHGGTAMLEPYAVEPQHYLLATLHRAENVDGAATFGELCRALGDVATLYGMPLILSVHPRIRDRLGDDMFGGADVRPVPAMPFSEFVGLQRHAALVLTDSGTVQEECAILKVPVLTLRNTTERPETLEWGSNIVTSTAREPILRAARYLHGLPRRGSWQPPPEYLATDTSERVVRILLSTGRHLHAGARAAR
jgi:UDP-N-acetylglucosamine 2-epimerase (non-hydrolysing)